MSNASNRNSCAARQALLLRPGAELRRLATLLATGLLCFSSLLSLSFGAPLVAQQPEEGELSARRGGLVMREASSLDSADLRTAVRRSKPGDGLRVRSVPLFDGPEAVLELERFEVFRADALVEVEGASGVSRLELPTERLFKGRVGGKNDSLAFLAVAENGELQGLVADDDRIFLIGSQARSGAASLDPPEARVWQLEDTDLAARQVPFECGNEDHAAALDVASLRPGLLPDLFSPADAGPISKTLAATANYAVDVALETDSEFYDLFGSSSGALGYINVLFGAIATIYDRDVSTQLRVSYTKLYSTSNDPWGTNSNTYLSDLVNYWNSNNSGISRTIVHQLRGINNNFGVAYVGTLCSPSYSYGLTTSVRGNFNPAQTVPVWDLVAVAHELGHNFSSRHTHCYNPPIDQCSTSGNGCYSGSVSVPSDGGTIMSYCHLNSGGMSNINTWLGRSGYYGNQSERVNQQILGHLGGAQSSGCLPAVQNTSLIFGDSFESGTFGGWSLGS